MLQKVPNQEWKVTTDPTQPLFFLQSQCICIFTPFLIHIELSTVEGKADQTQAVVSIL